MLVMHYKVGMQNHMFLMVISILLDPWKDILATHYEMCWDNLSQEASGISLDCSRGHGPRGYMV